MTDEESLERAKIFIACGAHDGSSETCSLLSWLLREAEAAQRARALAEEWEARDVSTPGYFDPDASATFAEELRRTLDGGEGCGPGRYAPPDGQLNCPACGMAYKAIREESER